MELDWLKKIWDQPLEEREKWIAAVEELAVSTPYQLLAVTRTVVYDKKRHLQKDVGELKCLLLQLLDGKCTRPSFYGTQRKTHYLCRRGRGVNRKRVQRLMQKLGLAAMAPGPIRASPTRCTRFIRTCCRVSRSLAPIRCGVPTSRTYDSRVDLCIWQRSSTGTAAKCCHNGCRTHRISGSAWAAWKKHSRATGYRRYSIPSRDRNSPATVSPEY